MYVIGAGFSKGCGYPLTSALLHDVWPRLPPHIRASLERIVRFHYPTLDPPTTLPDIEKLLTQIAVNIDLFESSRWHSGALTRESLVEARDELLSEIATRFHDLYRTAHTTGWLGDFVGRISDEQAGVISFNWDLLLEQSLWGDNTPPQRYGLTRTLPKKGPVILKPHGSLNWYIKADLKGVTPSSYREIFPSKDSSQAVCAFLHPRAIRSKVGRRYKPLLVAPTFLKDFSRPIFRQIWRHATEVLGTANKVIFLGYSLPADDLQARFILRCGFHNQLDGILRSGGRLRPTGNAEVAVVNPDPKVAERVRELANRGAKMSHRRETIEEWLARTK